MHPKNISTFSSPTNHSAAPMARKKGKGFRSLDRTPLMGANSVRLGGGLILGRERTRISSFAFGHRPTHSKVNEPAKQKPGLKRWSGLFGGVNASRSGGWKGSSKVREGVTTAVLNNTKPAFLPKAPRKFLAFKPGVCFRCGEAAHFKSVCRKGRVCFLCKGIGHSTKRCKRGHRRMENQEERPCSFWLDLKAYLSSFRWRHLT